MKFLRESKVMGKALTERKSVVGSYHSYDKDIFRQTFLDPHKEMEFCVKMFNRNSLANAGVKTMKDFIKGGEIRVKSLDENSRILCQRYLNDINIDFWLDELIENLIKTGNGYAEFEYSENMPDVIVRGNAITDSSRIYINCDEYGNPTKTRKLVNVNGELTYQEVDNIDEYYIQRIDPQFRTKDAKFYSLSYQFGSMFAQNQIYGIPISKQNMLHIKLGIGDIGVYGRSDLASTITDFEILEQIERSIAIIAKHKSVPRDIITYGSDENPATDDEVNDFIIYLESLQKDESAIINKPIKRETLSYAGQDINLDYMITHIKKKLMAGIAPDFALGIGDGNSSKQSSQLTLLSYILSIYSKRKLILKPIEDKVLKPFIQRMGLKDCWLEFGELDFETKSEKTNRVGAMWTQNVLTLNEIRYQLGFPVLKNGNVFFSQWQQELISSVVDDDNSDNDDDLKKIISDDEEKGSPGANVQEPNQRLPNNDSNEDVFNHREAPNKKTIQKGRPIDMNKKQNPRNIVKKNEYKELMNDIRSLEKTLTINIELEDEQNEIVEKEDGLIIDFKTLIDKFYYIFNEPMTTEIYYKKVNDLYEISFKTPNNVMIICKFNDLDITTYYNRNTQLSDDQKKEFVQNWINQHTQKTIEVK